MNHKKNLSIEIKTKIITMRKYSTATFAEIANQCGCSVSFLANKNILKPHMKFLSLQIYRVVLWIEFDILGANGKKLVEKI